MNRPIRCPRKVSPGVEALLRRMDDFMRMQGKSLATRRQYGQWCRRFALWLDAPAQWHLRSATPEARMEAFLTWIVVERDVSASTQNVAFSALLFLYEAFQKKKLKDIDALRSTRPVFIRMSLPQSQVIPVLNAVRDEGGVPFQLILWTIYGCGLRLNEALSLRIADVKIESSELVIQEAKHGHSRVVPVPCRLIPALQWQLAEAKWSAARDRRMGQPCQVPHAFRHKDRLAPFRERWGFFFPWPRLMREPDTGAMLRWHAPDWAVQRALRGAATPAGLDGLLTPHVLRHCFATDFPYDVKLLQEIMGHKDIRTTMGYRHPALNGAPLPLDTFRGEIRLIEPAARRPITPLLING
jgi:site-specific recombinase XerD